MTAAERTYTTVNKSDWGPGAWQDEPDKIQWIDEATGLDCLIHRSPLGALCGYVGVPPGHPSHGLDYDAVTVGPGEDGYYPDVHGGLTYAGPCAETDDESVGICHVPGPGRPADVWWLGFDCGHSCDVVPVMLKTERARGWPHIAWPGGESYKTVAYVRAEVAKLAGQLAEVCAQSALRRGASGS